MPFIIREMPTRRNYLGGNGYPDHPTTHHVPLPCQNPRSLFWKLKATEVSCDGGTRAVVTGHIASCPVNSHSIGI